MSTFIDPYIDRQTGILRNLVGAKSYDELYAAEADSALSAELELTNIARTNDFCELCAIHKAVFGKIYDWAGQPRTVDIRKSEDGSEYFLIVSRIPTGSNYVFGELKAKDGLKGLKRDDFIKRLAYFYDQLNYIHPFREGNGRSQRIFWNRVAKDAGYRLDWSRVTSTENNAASKLAAEKLDLSLLIEMFNKIVDEVGS